MTVKWRTPASHSLILKSCGLPAWMDRWFDLCLWQSGCWVLKWWHGEQLGDMQKTFGNENHSLGKIWLLLSGKEACRWGVAAVTRVGQQNQFILDQEVLSSYTRIVRPRVITNFLIPTSRKASVVYFCFFYSLFPPSFQTVPKQSQRSF